MSVRAAAAARAARSPGVAGWAPRGRRAASQWPPPPGVVDVARLLRDAEAAAGPGAALARGPARRSVLLFPGQGSQALGMGRALLRFPRARALYAAARRVLGYDLLRLSLQGPREALDRTVHCQPAVFVASLAAVEKLRAQQPAVIEGCVAAAGFSVGEFAALVFAGAMDFDEGLHAVKVRAEAMQEASEAVPSGMLSVLGQPQSKFALACQEAREHCAASGLKDPVCEALRFLQKNSARFHFRRAKLLPVSGAFHTRLMEPAQEPLARALRDVRVRKPLVAVHANVSGHRYADPKHIPRLLVQQVVAPVKWEQTMHIIYERKKGTPFPRTFEVGPGRQLGSILRSCNMQAWKSYSSVDVVTPDEEDVDPDPDPAPAP